MIYPSPLVISSLFALLSCSHSWIMRPLMPSKYILEIKTDLEEGTFSGRVEIVVNCEISTKAISLNALKEKLSIDENKIFVADQKDPTTNLVEKAVWGATDDTFLIETKKSIHPGENLAITVPFEGLLGDGAQDGYFRINDENGYIAANEFANMKAGSGFPCFDESFMKAVFVVILHRRENEKTLSSMNLKQTTKKKDDDGWETDEYEPTVKLSPHLVSYVVTNIPLKFTPTCEQKIKFWFKEDSKDSEIAGKFACRLTVEQSTTFSQFYNLPPLKDSESKIDVFLHPKFPYNYLGGWGLILSRETPRMKYIWDISDKYITYVRLGYQYFGGIVSFDSGNSFLFFKALIQYLSNNLLIRDDYSYEAENLLYVDGGMLTNQFVGEFDPDHYNWGSNSLGGYISWDNNNYSTYIERKGTLLLRMIHRTIGGSVFKKALRNFYNTYRYQYASANDFWSILNWEAKPSPERLIIPITTKMEKSNWWGETTLIPSMYKNTVAQTLCKSAPSSNLPLGISVGNAMQTWVEYDDKEAIQFDYPVIKVTRINSKSINVKQERFQGNWVKKETEKAETKFWWIPLTYTTAGKPNFQQMTPTGWIGPVHGTNGVKLYAPTEEKEWIIFNIQHVGLYRVQYELNNWNLIINALNKRNEFEKIHYLNRVQLVRDALDFGFLGDLLYDYVFRLLNYLRYEENPVVWRVFFQHIRNLESAIRRTSHYDKYKENMKQLLTTLYVKIFPERKWISVFNLPFGNDVERTEAEFKMIVLKESSAVGVDDVITLFRETFEEWKSEGNVPEHKNRIQKELITLTISTTLANEDENDFQFIFKQLEACNDKDKNSIVYQTAIQYTKNEASIGRVLDWVFSQDSNAVQAEKSELIRIFVSQPITFTPVLNYVYSNFEKVKTNTNSDDLKVIVKIFALEMSESELNQLEKFIQEKPELSSDEDIKEILKQGRIGYQRRRDWLEANSHSLEEGFSAWKYNIKSE